MQTAKKFPIPLDDIWILDKLVERMWHHDRKARNELVDIIADYYRRGFDTLHYATQILSYSSRVKIGQLVY